jgi:hypothetical protein
MMGRIQYEGMILISLMLYVAIAIMDLPFYYVTYQPSQQVLMFVAHVLSIRVIAQLSNER